MNTIKIYYKESGEIWDVKKDFPLYQGQYHDKLLNVYVPTSVLAPQFDVSDEDYVYADSVASTAVKMGVTHVSRDGKLRQSKSYFCTILKPCYKTG